MVWTITDSFKRCIALNNPPPAVLRLLHQYVGCDEMLTDKTPTDGGNTAMVQPTHVDFNLKRKIVAPPPLSGDMPPPDALDESWSTTRMFLSGIAVGVVWASLAVVVWKAGLNIVFWDHVWPHVARDPTLFVMFVVILIFVVRTSFSRKPLATPPHSPARTRLRRVPPHDDPPNAA